MSKEEQRKFLVKLGDGGGDILKKLCMVYGDRALKMMAVYKWVARYKEGRKSLKDDVCSGRPISTHNDENVKRIDELLATNQRISNHYIAETLGVNRETVRKIFVCENSVCILYQSHSRWNKNNVGLMSPPIGSRNA